MKLPPSALLLLASVGSRAGVDAWITTAQGSFGASISNIRAQLAGAPRPEGVSPQVKFPSAHERWPTHTSSLRSFYLRNVDNATQAELSALWSHNPEGRVGLNAITSDSTFERLRGLGGGITWSFDSSLCDQLLPKFREGAILIKTVECGDIKASVQRAFGKWASNNRHIQFFDVTTECEKLGINTGPSTGVTHPALYQEQGREDGSPPSLFHGGCPLAEIWVTAMLPPQPPPPPPQSPQAPPSSRRQLSARRHSTARSESSFTTSRVGSSGRRRRVYADARVLASGELMNLDEGEEAEGVLDHGGAGAGAGAGWHDGREEDGGYNYEGGNGSSVQSRGGMVVRRRLQGGGNVGGDIAVATALTYWRVTENFYFTNGERPFYLDQRDNTTRNYARRFVEGYAGRLSIAIDGKIEGGTTRFGHSWTSPSVILQWLTKQCPLTHSHTGLSLSLC